MKNKQYSLGDIGFYNDSNALWNNYIPKILNNFDKQRRGGIFRILPGHKETPVLIPSLKLPLFNSGTFSKMYGFDYTIASDEQSCQKD
jgi:2-succinyl-5-enolpyruvyl-6-hydroxy-3-cyclohexene-1-carboxylate synthase